MTAGAVIFFGAAQSTIAVVIADALFPNYNIYFNHVSDLGANCNASCIVYQPGADIFNASLCILGVAVAAGAYLLRRSSVPNVFTVLLGAVGVAASGIGLFS